MEYGGYTATENDPFVTAMLADGFNAPVAEVAVTRGSVKANVPEIRVSVSSVTVLVPICAPEAAAKTSPSRCMITDA